MAQFPKEDARFRARACPRDHEPLARETVAVRGPDVIVDRCPKCEGVFLDKNELLRITGDARLNAHLRDDTGYDSDSTLVCPHCGGIMDAEEAAGAVVEVCLSCFGIWLDKGELDALRSRPNAELVHHAPSKAAELDKAVDVKRRLRVEEAKRQGRGAGGFVRRRFLWLDDTLDEVVRRYL